MFRNSAWQDIQKILHVAKTLSQVNRFRTIIHFSQVIDEYLEVCAPARTVLSNTILARVISLCVALSPQLLVRNVEAPSTCGPTLSWMALAKRGKIAMLTVVSNRWRTGKSARSSLLYWIHFGAYDHFATDICLIAICLFELTTKTLHTQWPKHVPRVNVDIA